MKKYLKKITAVIIRSHEKESGFTLIDIMVTVGIFTLLATVLFANYPDSATKVELANAVSDMQGVVRESQLRAGGMETAGDTAAGYGLYFDAASTTNFFQFKDSAQASTTDFTGGALGDSLFNLSTELLKKISIPEGFYLRNICVGDGTARPFASSSCSRTNPVLGTVTVSYPRLTTQPIIYSNNATSTRYAAACIEFASTKSVEIGKVRNMIISQSGFTSAAIGACDEAPINYALNTTPNNGAGGLLVTSGTTVYGVDRTPPAITLTGGDDIDVYFGEVYTDPGAIVIDDVDGNITSKVVSTVLSVTSTSSPYTYASTTDYVFGSVMSPADDFYALDLSGIFKISSSGDVSRIPVFGRSSRGAVVKDSSDNLYIPGSAGVPGSGVVLKVTPAGTSTVFGVTGGFPHGIVRDSSGNIYTANYGSNNVTKITPGGVSTILGTTGTNPTAIAIDLSGNIYTANYGSNNITKITPGGVSTILGTTGTNPKDLLFMSEASGEYIYTANYGSNNVSRINIGTGSSVIFATTGANPNAIAKDSAKNIYTANLNSNNVTKITPGGVSSVFAAVSGFPTAIQFDSSDNAYVSSTKAGSNITKITPAGSTSSYGSVTNLGQSVFDSSGNLFVVDSGVVQKVRLDLSTSVFAFLSPTNSGSVTQGSDGSLYLFQKMYNVVAKVSLTGEVKVFGTTGTSPSGITSDSSGNIYTANYGSNNVTKITPGGVSTILGTTGTSPSGITSDSFGNIYTANYGSNNVTKITPGGVSSIAGTTGTNPKAIALDASGNIYTANTGSHDVSKIEPAGPSGILGKTGRKPVGIAVDSSGNVYAANVDSCNISKTKQDGSTEMMATTMVAPSNVQISSTGDIISVGETNFAAHCKTYVATKKVLNPSVSTVSTSTVNTFSLGTYKVNYSARDASGNLATKERRVNVIAAKPVLKVISDWGSVTPYYGIIDSTKNFFVTQISLVMRKLTPGGVLSLFGIGSSSVNDLTIDPSDNIYLARTNNTVTKLTPGGATTTFGTTGMLPLAITLDASGNVYTANGSANNVTKITPGGVSSVLGTTGTNPSAIAVDASGNVFVVNKNSNTITKITPAGVSTSYGSLDANSTKLILDNQTTDALVLSYNSASLKRVNPSASGLVASTESSPVSMVQDSHGNVYIGHQGSSNRIIKVTPSGAVVPIEVNYSPIVSLSIDSDDYLYVVTKSEDAAFKLQVRSY